MENKAKNGIPPLLGFQGSLLLLLMYLLHGELLQVDILNFSHGLVDPMGWLA